MNIQLPQKIDVKEIEEGKRADITIEPCYPGYGTTLGNALRRVLLSSLPGAAISAVKFKGVQHEFSTIPHAKEDVVDILQNLKRIRLKLHSEEAVTLKLSVKGEMAVTAKDIAKHAEVEISNPDQVIVTLTDAAAVFDMELTVEHGIGYTPVEAKKSENKEIGVIAVDALFNPVQEVSFHTEDVRVGQMTNFDKLVLSIETDGTMTPIEAFERSSEILVDHFTLLRDFTKEGEKKAVEQVDNDEEVVEDAPEKEEDGS